MNSKKLHEFVQTLTREEREALARIARGFMTAKTIYWAGNSKIKAIGFQYDPYPSTYVLLFEGEEVISSSSIEDLFDTDLYMNVAINENDIDEMRQQYEDNPDFNW